MALTNTNIPNDASDVVGVFDQEFNQVFPLARPIKCIVDESAKAMEHPVETGTVITDHIIYEPNEIELSMILPRGEYRSVYQQIEQIYRSSTILTVQTKTATYSNMYIYRLPHQEDAELFDVIALIIRMRQVIIFSTTAQALSADQVEDPTDQSTVKKGLQLPSSTKVLPPPEDFDDAKAFFNPNAAGLKLEEKNTGVEGPAPNKESYLKYIENDIGIEENLTQDQLEQLLEAK